MTPTMMTRVVVHKPDCADARKPAVIEAKVVPSRDADDYALPHTCLPGGWAGEYVVQVTERIRTHEYRPGKMHPVGLRQPLCADCRRPRQHHP